MNVKENSLCYKISLLWKTWLKSQFSPILYSDRETLIHKVDSTAKGEEAGGRWQGSPRSSFPSLDCPLASLPKSERQSDNIIPSANSQPVSTSNPLRISANGCHQLCKAYSASKAALFPFYSTICNYYSFLCTPVRCYPHYQAHKLCSVNSRLPFHQPGQQCSKCHPSILRQ